MKFFATGRIVAVGTLLAAVFLAGCPGKTPGGPGNNSTTAPVSTSDAAKLVGSLDNEQIFQLPEFKKAKEDLEKKMKAKEEELRKKLPKDKAPTPEQQQMIRTAQLEMQKEQAKLLNPLKLRAEAAVAVVTREKKMQVVLDKKIVVFGVPDITEDVKKVFQGPGEIKLPGEIDTSKAPIGYFDQEVVRQLKLFQEAEVSIAKKRMELMKAAQARAAKMSPSEQQMLERELRMKLESYEQQTIQPLIQQVNDSVKDVAVAQGLSLVLDKQHVMQGGRNMTNEVVEAFLKRAGGGSAPKPKASGTPAAATATPSATVTP